MPKRKGWGHLAVAACLMLANAAAWAAPTRHALIVAIGSYAGLPRGAQLEGPAHDADALRSVLVRRWGFEAERVQVLLNEQASKRAILDAIRALQTRTQPDDEVLIYFSGHGTSSLDSGTERVAAQPHSSGAFIAADFKGLNQDAAIRCTGPSPDDGLIVGCRDLRPLLDALDNERTGRRHLWVIADSCYSGQVVRGQSRPEIRVDQPPSRMVPLRYGEQAKSQVDDLVRAARQTPPAPYPYRQVQFLAAASQGEPAADIPTAIVKAKPTFDGRPHGALTDALLGVLEGKLAADFDGDGWLSLAEVHRAVAEYLGRRSFAQTPQRLPSVADDQRGLANEPVLRVQGAAAKPLPGASSPLKLQLVNTSVALREALRGFSELSMVTTPDDADLRVVANGGRLLMASSGGDLITGLPDDSVDAAVRQLRQLAWAKQLRQLAEGYRRGVLAVEVEPAAQGGNFLLGQTLAFAARPDREATLLLLVVSSDGKVTTLYPNKLAEAQRKPAQTLVRLPDTCAGLAVDDPRRQSQCIVVSPPLGMDFVMAFGFDTAPRSLDALMTVQQASVDDARLAAFLRELPSLKGRFTFSSVQLRTLEAPKP